MKRIVATALLLSLPSRLLAEESMDNLWGGPADPARTNSAARTQFFQDGNYGLFMHWGLYSHLGGQWKDQTFYGIGEWIKRQMKIPEAEYMALAREFNPADFDAKEIARIAKQAGMRWIIITSKHHEGFAMFKSAHPFNIVDATPFRRDPMKELAEACREAGLGFGFYYSHNQDWTAPGGSGGPAKNPDGSPATFEQYFKEKCYPQVKEICTQYGPLKFVWFDTPGNMPKEHVLDLVKLVKETQPGALMCSRVGHGLGDYDSKGDMEVPLRNATNLWETCDTTDDSWSYAWYDQNWKDSREILHRLVSTVGRGGTYLLNVGPDGRGRLPEGAVKYLTRIGQWVNANGECIHGASASPFPAKPPWGYVTCRPGRVYLIVKDWQPVLTIPALKNPFIRSSQDVVRGETEWNVTLSGAKPSEPFAVVSLEVEGMPAAR
jgi:alpha-L-fucosidase